MLAEPRLPHPRFRGEHAPARPRWPVVQTRTSDAETTSTTLESWGPALWGRAEAGRPTRTGPATVWS